MEMKDGGGGDHCAIDMKPAAHMWPASADDPYNWDYSGMELLIEESEETDDDDIELPPEELGEDTEEYEEGDIAGDDDTTSDDDYYTSEGRETRPNTESAPAWGYFF